MSSSRFTQNWWRISLNSIIKKGGTESFDGECDKSDEYDIGLISILTSEASY